MKPIIASIGIPGKSKSHVALLPVSFRLGTHSPAESNKVCVSFNDKNGTLIYITLYPDTEDSKDYLRDMSVEQRTKVAQILCKDILEEIGLFLATNMDWTGTYQPTANLMLDDWRCHWEDCLDTIILEVMQDRN